MTPLARDEVEVVPTSLPLDSRFVLDTSAVFCLLNDEPGADRVESILQAARAEPPQASVLLPFMALMELHYHLLRVHPAETAREILNRVQFWPVVIVESDPVWRTHAAEVKATGNLSVADAWMAGLATLRDALLVHKDPEFDAFQALRVVRLP